jgi:hypothetical protein
VEVLVIKNSDRLGLNKTAGNNSFAKAGLKEVNETV